MAEAGPPRDYDFDATDDPTSGHHSSNKQQCSNCHSWKDPEQFRSRAKGHRALTKTCLDCREGKRPMSTPKPRSENTSWGTTAATREQTQVRHSRSTKRGKAPVSELVPTDEDTTDGDTTDPEEYNIRSEERVELLIELRGLINNASVSSTLWALCQLCDLTKLSLLRDMSKLDPKYLQRFEPNLIFIPLLWTQRILQDSEKSKPEGKKKVERSKKVRSFCERRDGKKCVLTGEDSYDVAHIFPHSMLSPPPPPGKQYKRSDGLPKFWDLLSMFWRDDQVNEWRSTLFPDPNNPDVGVEAPFNLICLSPTAHRLWNDGKFALKPLRLSNDKSTLTIKFFWQIRSDYLPESRVDLMIPPTTSRDLTASGNCKLVYGVGDPIQPIKSGDVITLRTPDPKELPLPSLALLNLQWYLQRLVAMAGAAGWPIFDFNDTDEDMSDSGTDLDDGSELTSTTSITSSSC